jgi:hypothetical protein
VATAQVRVIDHVVVQQGSRVNKFNNRGHVEALISGVTERTATQQQKCRAQPLTAGRDDVLGHAAYQGNAGVQSLCDNLIDTEHVVFDDG